MKLEEILIRLEVGVSLGDRQQTAERAGDSSLVLLELVKSLWVRQDVRRQLHLSGMRARFGHLGKDLLLLVRVVFDGFDEVRNEIGAALMLIQHLAPGSLNLLVLSGDFIYAATR